MNVTQLSQAARASIDTLAGLNSRTLASVEQLAALNVQTVKTVQTEAAESVQAALSAKSLAELLQLQASSLQAVPQKAAAYGRHAGEILVTLAAAQRATVEAQVSSLQDRFLEGLAGAVSNVPGGDNALVVAKSAVAAVNDVYEGVDKVSRQVSDAVVANVTKMTAAVQRSAPVSNEVVEVAAA